MHRFLFILVASFFAQANNAAEAIRTLDARVYHLGTPGFPEWEEFAKSQAHGRRLDIKFEAVPNAQPQTLLIRQRQVKARWPVLLNNQRIGYLLNIDSKLVHSITVPAGKLRAGENILSIVAPKTTDDIEVGPVKLTARSPEQLFSAALTVAVTNKKNDHSIPCRITVVNEHDALAAVLPEPNQQLAHRPGVIYLSSGNLRLNLQPGQYTIYASRGFEYSVAKQTVTVNKGNPARVKLVLRHEVPTPGLVATDTHIHTLTRSGHGDSSEVERMHTIAGEGIEFAVATDHNHHADYRPVQKTTGTTAFFTAVTGNEVTTNAGHFNAFPIVPSSAVPDAKLTDWSKLIPAIRATPDVRVIVLNHPRNTHSGFSPVAPEHFNRVTGRNLYGEPYSFDAMEVVTSAAMQSDYMAPYRDWFAMLNWGHNVAGVGSSDTHDVSRFILGQARTYVECPDTNPAKLDVAKACESFRRMHAYISMGLLTMIKVDGRYRAGDFVKSLKKEMAVSVQVLGPSWAKADRLDIYANGQMIYTQPIKPSSTIEKAKLNLTLPSPKHDTHLIAIATGPGITEPFWESPRPYVPTSRKHEPRVQGATNPIFLDGDGDGKYTPPRLQAEQMFAKYSKDLSSLFSTLSSKDSAIAAQLASVMHRSGLKLNLPSIRKHWAANSSTRLGFEAYLKTIPSSGSK